MNCPKCDGILKLHTNAAIKQEFKGVMLLLNSSAYVCEICWFQLLQEGQGDELRRNTADEYRRQNGLLLSAEIKACRKLLNYTQEQFAEFLGVSPVSIKRWETWQVQEPIYDKLIRDKCGIGSPAYEDMVMLGFRFLLQKIHLVVCRPTIVCNTGINIDAGLEEAYASGSCEFADIKVSENTPFLKSRDREPIQLVTYHDIALAS